VIIGGWSEYAPGNRDVVLGLLIAAAEASRRDPGCQEFLVAADPTHPDRIILFERWTSSADQTRHLETEHVQEFVRRVAAHPMVANAIQHYRVQADGP
jgi:quinol monooxygenase YgiN